MNQTKAPEHKAYKVTLILLVGLASFSTAMKDLNRLQELVSGVQAFTNKWRGTEVVTRNEEQTPGALAQAVSCQQGNASTPSAGEQLIAAATGTGTEMVDYDEMSEPEIGGGVELLSSRATNRSTARVSRTRYSSAKSLRGEFSARSGDRHRPAHFEYRTFDRVVSVDIPMSLFHDIKADENEIPVAAQVPVSLVNRFNRRQFRGKSDNGKREFIFRTIERNVAARPAS
jgi:hypothetical protein